MPQSMRAKFYITNIEQFGEPVSQERLNFSAVGKSGGYGDDGLDEDNTYARFSPQGSLSLTIANPALLGKFAAGEKFYLNFTPAE
jgi:hypothetical protein